MVLSHNKLSNKLLHILSPCLYGVRGYGKNTLPVEQFPYTYANRRNKVNLVQPTVSTSGVTPQLTLSEYLKDILSSSPAKGKNRSGYAEVLDSKINNLKSNNLESAPSSFLRSSSSNSAMPTFMGNGVITGKSVEDFKNFLSNNKIKIIEEDYDFYKKIIETIKFEPEEPNKESSVNKYKKLIAAQIAELCHMSLFLGLNNAAATQSQQTTLSNKDTKIVEAATQHSNLSCDAHLSYFTAYGNNRQYLNALTNFDFKLSNSYYDYFHFNKSNNNKYLFAMEKATSLLKLVFLSKGCLISKPIFNVVYNSSNIEEEIKNASKTLNATLAGVRQNDKPKIIINLFYFVNFSSKKVEKITNIYNDKFLFLSEYLNKLFNCDVELNLVRLYLPYQDSNILAQYLNIGSFKKRFVYLASRLFRTVKIFKNSGANRGIKTTLPNGKILPSCILNGPFAPLAGINDNTSFKVAYPSGVSGINIKLAGRTPTQKLIPRVAVRRAQRGNFSRLNSKMIEKSMCIDTSKKGSFNFTVRLSHVFR